MTAADLRARYEAAERLLPHRWKDLVFSLRVRPRWLDDDRFWYANPTREGTEFVLVEPRERVRRPAFDHGVLAKALSQQLDREVSPAALPIDGLEHGAVLHLNVEGQVWHFDPAAASVQPTGEPAPASYESVSPDGRWAVFTRDHNLVLRERATGFERLLTHDGVDGHAYGAAPDSTPGRITLDRAGLRMPPAVVWSPCSRRLVTHRLDERAVPFMHYVESGPADGGRARTHRRRYAMVGEPAVPTVELLVIDVASGLRVPARCEPFPLRWYYSPIRLREVWWDRRGERVCFIAGDRGDGVLRLCTLDPDTGATEILVEEVGATQVQTRPNYPARPNAHVLGTGEAVWWSERSGWGHLYLRAADGSLRALTGGEWLVRDLVCVDEQHRFAIFTGAGREVGLDPYARQLYRVDLDGGAVRRLIDDTLDHDVTATPSGCYLVDVASWLDTPSRSVVRDLAGEVVVELEHADAGLLTAAGWSPPERIAVKAADGVTDLYGLLYRPHGFDPEARYPVLDDIYPGPQCTAAGIRFAEPGLDVHAASMAALGFAVVVVDGRGTPLRSKAFQDHCRGPRDGENLDDHVAAIRQLAATRPWLDVDRVGIYGTSGGGRAAVQAMLRHPDFFTAAVSSCGDHDDRFYHMFWGEKYVATDYRSRANASYADRLRGKLLLIHGELDDNVPPHHTLRLVDALMAADKDFDLLVVPGADHSLSVHRAYWLRRRWDYFVRHLYGAEPPPYRIAEIPPDLPALTDAWSP